MPGPRKSGKTLSDAIDDFVAHRKSGWAKGTSRITEISLRHFLGFTGNIRMSSIGPQHAERFQAHEVGRGLMPNTINTSVAQIRVFAKWTVVHGYAKVNWTATLRSIPVPATSRMRVAAQDFPRLLDLADEGRRPDRRIVVALGLFLFLRAGEVQSLRVKDVDLQQGTIDVRVHKTHGFDVMPISWELDQELRRWFKAYEADLGRRLTGEEYLVPGARGWNIHTGPPETGLFRPHLHQNRPFHQVQAALIKAGYPIDTNGKSNQEGMHTLRRSGARALFDALVSGRLGDLARDDALRKVSAMLHHKSIVTTEHYLGLDVDRERRDDTIKGRRMFFYEPEVQDGAQITPFPTAGTTLGLSSGAGGY